MSKNSRQMMPGEKLIWAAAYAKALDVSHPPVEVIVDEKRWKNWERGMTHMAIEFAAGAVSRARAELDAVREGFGADSDVYQMLEQMFWK